MLISLPHYLKITPFKEAYITQLKLIYYSDEDFILSPLYSPSVFLLLNNNKPVLYDLKGSYSTLLLKVTTLIPCSTEWPAWNMFIGNDTVEANSIQGFSIGRAKFSHVTWPQTGC